MKIILADAQFLTRSGLSGLLTGVENAVIVAEAENSAQLKAELARTKPDMVIIDYNQPGHFSLNDLEEINEKYPQTRIMVVTADKEGVNVFQALKSGANCMVTKNCSKAEIISAVQSTSRGEKFFCNTILDLIIEKQMPKAVSCEPTKLTTRELEILELISKGVKTGKMAEMLFLSTHTIYTHRKNIMKKLGINSVSGLILHALKTGLASSSQTAPTV